MSSSKKRTPREEVFLFFFFNGMWSVVKLRILYLQALQMECPMFQLINGRCFVVFSVDSTLYNPNRMPMLKFKNTHTRGTPLLSTISYEPEWHVFRIPSVTKSKFQTASVCSPMYIPKSAQVLFDAQTRRRECVDFLYIVDPPFFIFICKMQSNFSRY